MERDLAAIQAKLDSLESEAQAIGKEHPEEAEVIRERVTQIQSIWEQLTQMVNRFLAAEILKYFRGVVCYEKNFFYSSKNETLNWKKPAICIASFEILIISRHG